MWTDQEQYKLLYKQINYGSGPNIDKHYKVIRNLILQENITRVFDYGCGKRVVILKQLINELPYLVPYGYDFAVENCEQTNILHNTIDYNFNPDILISTDCLEHVPEKELEQCWKEFNQLAPKHMYLVISCYVARTILPDGTNAHKTVKPSNWWHQTLEKALPNYHIEPFNLEESKLHNEAYFYLKHN